MTVAGNHMISKYFSKKRNKNPKFFRNKKTNTDDSKCQHLIQLVV